MNYNKSDISLPKGFALINGKWYQVTSKHVYKLKCHGKCEKCNKEIWRMPRASKQHYRFCSKICKSVVLQKGKKSPNWKGGKKKDKKGYVHLYKPEYAKTKTQGYIPEHRLLIEKKIGRRLDRNEIVHHLNKKTSDNNLCNLRVISRSEHMSLHQKGIKKSNEQIEKFREISRNNIKTRKRDIKTGRLLKG